MKRPARIFVASSLLTAITLSLWIWWNSHGIMTGMEEAVMQKITVASLLGGTDYEDVPDDFVFINTSCDLSLAEVSDEYGMPRGNICITDREKLLQLISRLSAQPHYKYIFLDILLDREIATPYDKSLADAINRTPRLVCASTENCNDYGIMPDKTAKADYKVSFFSNDFCCYLTRCDGEPSLAYKAYSSLNQENGAITPDGFIPGLRFNCTRKYNTEGEIMIYDLGEDLIGPDADIHNIVKDKYVFVGAFGSDDVHPTYLGLMDGIQIHANAFAGMLRHHHELSRTMLLVIGSLVMAMYVALIISKSRHAARQSLTGSAAKKALKKLLDRKWARLLLSFISVEMIFNVFLVTVYLVSGRITEIASLSILFTILWCVSGETYARMLKKLNNMASTLMLLKSSAFRILSRKAALLALMAATAASLAAENLRILYVSTPGTINVGGEPKTKGDTIKSAEPIAWKADKQAIKVIGLDSGKISIVASSHGNSRKSLTLDSYLHGRKTLAHRHGEPATAEALSAAMPDTLPLLDKIALPCGIRQDCSHYFFISYDYNGERINKRLPATDGFLTIDRDIYIIDGKNTQPRSMPVSIFYRDTANGIVKIIGENIYIDVYDM